METPESVQERIHMTDILDDTIIQDLEDAWGAVVNMDHFSVTVNGNEIPNGWSATEYLNHIRTNINNYVDGSSFEFYPGSPNEQDLWNSSNPEGTLFSIQLVENLPWLDDGSVVTNGAESTDWTFTTLYTPENKWHPVSGNRRFGFIDNNNGTYTFYTRGVDRLTTRVDQWAQTVFGIPFGMADDLWKSFTDLIAQDFDNAEIHDPIKRRPNYAKIAQLLNGQASPSTLGCQQ